MRNVDDCPLCKIWREAYRLIADDGLVYATVPKEPLVEGHVMVVPKRHTTMDGLKPDELVGMNAMITGLKTRLMELYPDGHPTIFTYDGGKHASVPDHLHYHLVPSPVKFRRLLAVYDPNVHEGKELERPELERMAKKIRGE